MVRPLFALYINGFRAGDGFTRQNVLKVISKKMTQAARHQHQRRIKFEIISYSSA